MPRGPRKLSPTGVYHVMTRGTNKQEIFIDDKDREKYLQILNKVRHIHNFELYAYSLMPNHNHLVVKDNDNSIQRFMQQINVSYARYFNWKYNRVGHLFQDRYRSEEILTDSQLLACVRYVHNNAYKAGMVSSPGDYPWSSYHNYLQNDSNTFVSCKFILGLFSENVITAQKEFIRFSRIQDNCTFIDLSPDSDEQQNIALLKNVITSILANHNMTAEKLSSRSASKDRSKVLQVILKTTGVSVRELAELLGISTYMIYRSFLHK